MATGGRPGEAGRSRWMMTLFYRGMACAVAAAQGTARWDNREHGAAGRAEARDREKPPDRGEHVATVHLIVGSLVFVSYLLLVIFYFLGMRGKALSFVRPLSMAGAVLLLVQYTLGFSLLGGDGEKPAGTHYILGLAAILTVGAEHALAPGQATPEKRSRVAFIASLGTLALVGVAYQLGQGGAS